MANEEKQEEKVEGEKKQEEKPVQKVELDQETYSALLDRIAELEAESTHPRRRQEEEVTDIDTLAQEGRRRQPAREEKEEEVGNLDELTNTQLAQLIINKVNEQGGQRLQKIEVAVETMRVMREIDKAEVKHEDFWQYEERIREIAMQNPTLSIERAYKMAKIEAEEEKPQKKEGEPENRPATRTEKLLKLPPRTFGEKPGAAVGSTKEADDVSTLRKAAEKAWDVNVGRDKTTI